MINSITIIGSSSGRNAGDAALFMAIMNSIDKACGRRLRYEIPTYRPEFVRQHCPPEAKPVSMLPWHGSVGMFGLPSLLSVLRTDLSLIYDNMLFDRKLYNPLFNFMPAAEFLLRQAKRYALYNIGAGPVSTRAGREMLRRIAEGAEFITVRDLDSERLLRDVGVKNPNLLVTADAALALEPTPVERAKEILLGLGLTPGQNILAINVNAYLNTWAEGSQTKLTAEEFAVTYAQALDKVYEQLGVSILFVCTQHHDVGITRIISERMRSKCPRALISNIEHSPTEIKAVLGQVSLLFAMRLHSAILCTGALTPSASLAFQKKVSSYYQCLGLPELAFSFDGFSSESLAHQIMSVWARREAIAAHLRTRIPELKLAADQAAQIVARMSSGSSGAEALTGIRA